MRWLTSKVPKTSSSIAVILLLLLTMVWIPASVVDTHGGALRLAPPVTATPTVHVTAVAQNLLKQQHDKLRRDNVFPWTLLNAARGASIGGIGIILLAFAVFISGKNGLKLWQRKRDKKRWQQEKEKEQRNQDEERLQSVVEGLGSESIAVKVDAAIALRSFLQEGYEQFHRRVFDLAVAQLRLPRTDTPLEDQTTPLPQHPSLSQALIDVFKEGFLLARHESKRSLLPPDATGIKLDNEHLVDADLKQVWMSGAHLRGANLNGADLSGADLIGADLSEADLIGANLSAANLSRANLSATDLSGADLHAANFMEAKLSRANLSEANLNRTKFRLAWLGGTILRRANLTGANFRAANLTGANLTGANFGGADLRGANFRGADLREADLREDGAAWVILREVDFRGADFTGANFNWTRLPSLQGTDLRGVKGLTKEQLEACKAQGAIIDEDATASLTYLWG